MRCWLIAGLLGLGALLLLRSPLGTRFGNELRALSDRLIIGVLQVSSGFEREAEASLHPGGR